MHFFLQKKWIAKSALKKSNTIGVSAEFQSVKKNVKNPFFLFN